MSDSTPRPISRRLRFEILRRDGYTCRYCGASAPDVALTVDHVIPVSLGGSDEANNLVTACQPCNAGKGSTKPDDGVVADVDAATLLFAKAMERAGQLLAEQRAENDVVILKWLQAWNDWGYDGKDGERIRILKDDNWRESIERFLVGGLSVDDLIALIPITMRGPALNDAKWKYYCGCCWRSLTERQELARRLIEDGQV